MDARVHTFPTEAVSQHPGWLPFLEQAWVGASGRIPNETAGSLWDEGRVTDCKSHRLDLPRVARPSRDNNGRPERHPVTRQSPNWHRASPRFKSIEAIRAAAKPSVQQPSGFRFGPEQGKTSDLGHPHQAPILGHTARRHHPSPDQRPLSIQSDPSLASLLSDATSGIMEATRFTVIKLSQRHHPPARRRCLKPNRNGSIHPPFPAPPPSGNGVNENGPKPRDSSKALGQLHPRSEPQTQKTTPSAGGQGLAPQVAWLGFIPRPARPCPLLSSRARRITRPQRATECCQFFRKKEGRLGGWFVCLVLGFGISTRSGACMSLGACYRLQVPGIFDVAHSPPS